MRPSPASTSVVVAALAVCLAGPAACSNTTDEAPFATPAPLGSSTTLPREGTLVDPEEEVSGPQGRAPAEIRADLDAALDDEDLCDLIEVLDSAVPDVDDPGAVVAVYRDVAETTEAATEFVPPVLTESWVVVVDASTAGAEAAERSGGDTSDPALRAAFGTADFTAALAAVDAWAIDNCG